ncbi:MAG: hypothetical protein IPL35_05395 [Sphingobacteriales bacterium]|nr:hypothetical protein [Sphingobacteriales bacterium]
MKKLIIPSIAGLIFTGYLLYEQKGTFGKSEVIVLILTAITLLGIIFLINKMTKND